jgi:hypothetical protein
MLPIANACDQLFVGYYSNNAEKLAFPLATNNADNQLSYWKLTTQIIRQSWYAALLLAAYNTANLFLLAAAWRCWPISC